MGRRAAALADRHRHAEAGQETALRLANAADPWRGFAAATFVPGRFRSATARLGARPSACVEAAKPGLVSLTSAVAKRKPDAMSVAHKEVNVALAEAGAAAAAAGCEENSKAPPGAAAAAAALAAAVTGGLVRALAEALAESPRVSHRGGFGRAAAARCAYRSPSR